MSEPQPHDGTNGTGPKMNRRQMIKTVGVGAGAAAVGAGAAPTVTQRAKALPDFVEAATTPVAPIAGYKIIDNWLGGSDVDEDQNTETYVYQVANTIHDLREGPTGDRTEIRQEFVNPPQGQSAFAQAAGSEIVAEAALATIEGESDKASQRAQNALQRQATRSILNLIEIHNSAVLRLVESGVLVESWEEGTSQFYSRDDQTAEVQPMDSAKLAEWEPVEQSQVESGGYLCFKSQAPASDFPMDPTNLEGRDEPVTIYAVNRYSSSFSENWHGAFATSGDYISQPWFGSFQDTNENSPAHEIYTTHPSLEQIKPLDSSLLHSALQQIADEYGEINSNMSSIVDDTVQGLEQGDISLSQVLSGEDLVNKFDPNNDRGQLHREAMALGMEMPSDVGFEALISHPELSADQLWCDLFLRTGDSNDLNINGPVTLSGSEYRSALIGYTGEASGEYQHQMLRSEDDNGNAQDLEILEIKTADQEVVEADTTVQAGGTVTLAPEDGESTPEPLANPDPKYDEWSIVVQAGDGSTSKHTVADAYIEDGNWKVDTTLSEGLAIEELRYAPPSTFNNTSLWTPSQSTYDVKTTEETIELRREVNEAIEEEFGSILGSGGDWFDFGLPSLPGLGVIESAVVVIILLAGANAASG